MTDEEAERLTAECQRVRSMLARAGVTILPQVDLPTPSELETIISRIFAAYPILNSPEVDKREVYNAIHFLKFVFRTEKVNTERSHGYWTDTAREFLRAQGLHPANMGLRSFCVAAIASGISFTLDEKNFPWSGLSFGLSLGSACRPSNKWRETLDQVSRPVEDGNYLRSNEERGHMVRETVKW